MKQYELVFRIIFAIQHCILLLLCIQPILWVCYLWKCNDLRLDYLYPLYVLVVCTVMLCLVIIPIESFILRNLSKRSCILRPETKMSKLIVTVFPKNEYLIFALWIIHAAVGIEAMERLGFDRGSFEYVNLCRPGNIIIFVAGVGVTFQTLALEKLTELDKYRR